MHIIARFFTRVQLSVFILELKISVFFVAVFDILHKQAHWGAQFPNGRALDSE